jgi:hypothetical protein
MKNYFFVEVNDWSKNDIEGLEVKCIIENAERTITPTTDFVLNQNERFYFLPGVSIPRIKLKELYASTKSKTVREIDEATKIIVGGKTKDKLFEWNWFYWIKTEAFEEVLLFIHNNNQMDTYKYNNIKEALETYTEDMLLCNYDLIRICNQLPINRELFCHSSERFDTVDSDYSDVLLPANLAKLCDESSLIELANGDESNTIDRSMYETLSEMFESDDTDNRVLAMEIMANSNYKESLLYLCFLFEQYSYQISNIKSRNHVNFKSLTNYMGFNSPTYCSMEKDDIVKLLIERDVFTKEMGMELLNKYKGEVEGSGGTKFFKVAKITFEERVINYLKEKNNVTNPE